MRALAFNDLFRLSLELSRGHRRRREAVASDLGGGQKLTQSGSAPSDKEVTGYSILEAENMEAAQALLAGHPHLEWKAGCEIEVHEAMPLPT